MGERGEVDSATIYTQHGQKTYFINIKENRYRDLFLAIAESLKNEAEGFERFVLNVFEEDVKHFFNHLERGKSLLKEVEKSNNRNDPLPESWVMRSGSGKKERYFRFAIHKRARVLELVISERKINETDNAFARTIRIDADSIDSVIYQYKRMQNRLLERKELRDNEPIRNPQLLNKYLKKDEPKVKVVKKVVVKRRINADDRSE
ncbi:DUF3276 family protein [Entomospira nematocerorum]|uniref:DUF3276 family protein n=1 Tax=Entomospira nematocerorum TaxID=2719987 RepID=A0A968KSY6_9SPIO|nr:DUF3276 family protein [Entomospira nematocera]NIZ47085.1 DUF3276 family protein [Entomospira nematocera]WDI34370.1 DUF3276 family protein [Entomospira nematocera]